MSKQTINIGASPNDGTGTPLRTSFDYTNQNFTELYTAVGPSGNNIVVPGNATITGDLTVRTNKLVVTSTGVGCGTATPALPFVVSNAGAQGFEINPNGSFIAGGIDILSYNRSTSLYKGIGFGAESYLFKLGTGFVTDAMTLNSTGLGIGVSPTYKLDVSSSSNIVGRVSSSNVFNTGFNITNTTASTWSLYSFGSNDATLQNSFGIYHQNGTSFLQITQAGNVGIGVTPSAWNYGKVIEFGGGSIFTDSGNNECSIVQGAYNNAGWKYKYTGLAVGLASNYLGTHAWYTAPSGTAGNAITFTQAMTLDASGNLLVGKTSAGAGAVGVQLESLGGVVSTLAGSTSATNTLIVYSTGAAAYRFYVGLDGTVNATNATISAISDARFKENVQDIDVGLNAILSLKPRKFDWKAGKGKDIKGDRGFIAQEFETVFPNLIDEWKDPAPEGEAPYKSVRQDLIPVLVKAIQELTARVQTLEAR